MVRRVRRNLSEKSVRKAVIQPQKSSLKQLPERSMSQYFRTALYLILLAVVLFISFKLVNNFNFDNFFSSNPSENTISGNESRQEDLNQPMNQEEGEAQAAPAESIRTEKVQPVPQKAQIEILNGCGVAGIASKTTNYCREKGIDVVYNGNFRNYAVKESYIIGWIDNKEDINKIAKTIGLDPAKVSFEKDSNKQLAASIILGGDYKKLNPFKN